MWKDFAYRGSYNWIDYYQNLIDEYNNSPHRGIGFMKPKDVSKSKEKFLLKTVYNRPKLFNKSKFKIGDFVRISKYKGIFDKGYLPNFSTEIFQIQKVHITNPVTYSLVDVNKNMILGKFYEEEMQKVKYPDIYLVEKVIKKNDKQALVKWLGFKKPTWIPIADLT